MKTTQITTGFLLSFITTVFALQWWQHPEEPVAVWFALAGAGLGALALLYRKQQEPGYLALALTIGSALAFVVVLLHTHVTGPQDVETFATGARSTVIGHITDAPDRRPLTTKYTVTVETIEQQGERTTAEGILLANDKNRWPRFAYGDAVTVRGTIERPAIIDDFDYPAYLSLQGIRAVSQNAQMEATEGGKPLTGTIPRISGALYDLRETFETQINRVQPEPHASLLAGLLTGSKRGIPDQLMDAFRTAGIAHIVAISGYNVTIILSLLGGLLFWLPLRGRFPFLVIGIVLFTIFVGGSSTVVRAAIMGILGLLALETGRLPSMRLGILWTAFVMLLWNPAFLWHDASFQLSFLAIIGITELGPWLKRVLRHMPEILGIREALVATLAAQIGTIPLTIVLFKQISLVAPFANVLVAPLVPLAMLFGFVSTVLSAFWMPLGLAVGYLAWVCLQGIILIATLSASVPFAAIPI
jgi:competence protein ComEC